MAWDFSRLRTPYTDLNPFVLLVGRPSLDLGTLGLKEGYGWSEWSGGVGIIRDSRKFRPVVSVSSGGVGMVRGKLRGIFEPAESLSALVHSGPLPARSLGRLEMGSLAA